MWVYVQSLALNSFKMEEYLQLISLLFNKCPWKLKSSSFTLNRMPENVTNSPGLFVVSLRNENLFRA